MLITSHLTGTETKMLRKIKNNEELIHARNRRRRFFFYRISKHFTQLLHHEIAENLSFLMRKLRRISNLFVKIIIEGSLLFSSHDRKRLAFNVMFLLPQKLSTSLVPIVLSNKVVQCLIYILSTNNTWLYKVGQHFLKQLSDWVGDDDVKRVAVIVSIQKHSNENLILS